MSHEVSLLENCFIKLCESIDSYTLPQRFTFPFYYEPHPLCLRGVKALQDHLQTQTDWTHDFGIDHHVDGVNVGKMFGVLLVKNQQGELGYLWAFSGKVAEQNHHPRFVPPVADIFEGNDFYRKEEKAIEGVTERIEALVTSKEYLQNRAYLESQLQLSTEQLSAKRQQMKEAKKVRKVKRQEAEEYLSGNELETLLESLKNESIKDHFEFKDLSKYWKAELKESEEKSVAFELELENLKQERRSKSAAVQKRLFDEFQFLNIKGKRKGLIEIFEGTTRKVPPAGAGECAMPKLLQHAFRHNMRPLAMAEFWWGQSPKSEIRKHGHFYPSCKGKCHPILSHMLDGMEVDESPLAYTSTLEKEIEVVYEDEHLLVINKPKDFLSVPGRTNADSVYSRMQKKYPKATGPLMVHRLDRATSGLMLIAKSKDIHKALQEQFLTKTIQKRYVALLEGVLPEDSGSIDLPLRVDIDDRPRQLVCYEHGKPALTNWKVLGRINGRTRIHFSPVTGRTHQLRVHAAHPLGLNLPIVGDDLYGDRDSRLHLHAESIAFDHPVNNERLVFEVAAEF